MTAMSDKSLLEFKKNISKYKTFRFYDHVQHSTCSTFSQIYLNVQNRLQSTI